MASDQPDQEQHRTNNNRQQHTNDNNHNQPTQEQGEQYPPPPPAVTPERQPGAPGFPVPPPAIGYPSMPGYPPPSSQGQSPHNYQPYPPIPPHYPYPAQAPPSAYYYASPNNVNCQNHPHGPPGRNTPSSRFLRAIVVTIMILLILTVTISYVLVLVYQPKAPSFHVDAFAVSNFNASSPSFTSTWDVALSIKNRNTKLKANFEGGDSYVYYQDKNVLGSSFIQPFTMETEAVAAVKVRIAAGNGGDAASVDKDVVAALASEKATTGAVVFGLRLRLETTFKSGYYSKLYLFQVDCNKLRVVFDNNGTSANGNLLAAADDKRDCDVYVYQ